MSAQNQLPIDIKDTKLVDWLVDRRWVNADFREEAADIRARINDAIQDMPDVDEITQMLAGSYITYYHCKRIVELLKVSEADTRSFFGTYSSSRMNDWLEIVLRYEADNVFLGESSRILQRNVEYEIPSLKRKIEAAKGRINDGHRRETELRTRAQAVSEKFAAKCSDMGLEGGDDIQGELRRLPDALPGELDKVVELLRADGVRRAITHYTAFVDFTLEGKPQEENPFGALQFLLEHGNVSCFEYETGKPLPDLAGASGAATEAAGGAADADAGGGEIDFGEIDFGGDGGGIDFGDGDAAATTEVAPGGGIVFGDDGGGIDFGGIGFGEIEAVEGIQVADFGADAAAGDGAENQGAGGEGPTMAQREPLLVNTAKRNLIVNQIVQLESFLTQRLEELNSDIDITSINQFEGAGPGVVQSKDAVSAMLDAVAAASAQLASPRLQQLFLIRTSANYVERLAASLRQQKYQSRTILGKIDRLEEQRAAAHKQIEEWTPQVDNLARQTKELQRNIEASVSKLYKGRPVNVIGEINNL